MGEEIVNNKKIELEQTDKTVKIIGWAAFVISIIEILRQVIFIIGQVVAYSSLPGYTIMISDLMYFILSLVIAIGVLILSNKVRREGIGNPVNTQKAFIYMIVLSVVKIVLELVIFDDTLPYLWILLVPFLVKGLIDSRKMVQKEK